MYEPTDKPWTPERLRPWSVEHDGEDSEPDGVKDAEVNPEDSPFPPIYGSDADRITAQIWACGDCGQLYEAEEPQPRPVLTCWRCGGNTFEARYQA